MEIKRNIFGKLCDDRQRPESSILVGPRQVGKTYLLRKIESHLRGCGDKTAFFDLEQPTVLAQFNQSDADLLEMLSTSGEVLFIDEFHYLKNASKLLKALYDRGDSTKIYASGSSAMEMHSHLKESLAGRKYVYPIYSCGLEEISQVIPCQPIQYLFQYGGMPGTIHEESETKKQQLLSDILQSYILKDIKSLVREENLRAFNHLLYLLAQSQGNLVSTDSLAREVGLSSHTINDYLELLSQTYVNFPVYSYSRNFGNELKKSKKYYLYDLGIRNALLKNYAAFDRRRDAGTIAESYVFLELQRQLTPDTEIRFWRLKSGDEVDFLWIKNQVPYPIEVKLNWPTTKVPKGLQSFLRRYPDTNRAFVIGSRSQEEIDFNSIRIHFLPLEKATELPALLLACSANLD